MPTTPLTLDQQVAALVTSVGNLVAAVSVSKATLDAAAASAVVAYRTAKLNIIGAVTQGLCQARWYPERAATITGIHFSLSSSSPTPVVIDLLVNGVSVLNGAYPTCTANQYLSSSVTLNVPVMPTDYLQVFVASAGGESAIASITYI